MRHDILLHEPSNMEFRNELISWTSISIQVQPRLKVVVGTVGETTGKREKGWRVTLTLNELRNYHLSHLRQSMSNVRAFESRGDSKMKIWTTTNFILFLTKLYFLHQFHWLSCNYANCSKDATALSWLSMLLFSRKPIITFSSIFTCWALSHLLFYKIRSDNVVCALYRQ